MNRESLHSSFIVRDYTYFTKYNLQYNWVKITKVYFNRKVKTENTSWILSIELSERYTKAMQWALSSEYETNMTDNSDDLCEKLKPLPENMQLKSSTRITCHEMGIASCWLLRRQSRQSSIWIGAGSWSWNWKLELEIGTWSLKFKA